MSAMNEGEMVLGVFLDLSKAFDTVDHEVLFMKMYKYGFEVPYNWFKSYLSNSKQYVSYKNFYSQQKTVLFGVPQGSILGPLLFLFYDMIYVSSVLFPIPFADDTNIFITKTSLK